MGAHAMVISHSQWHGYVKIDEKIHDSHSTKGPWHGCVKGQLVFENMTLIFFQFADVKEAYRVMAIDGIH